MKLSDMAIKQAKPRPKPYKMADGRGLYLFIMPHGGKAWRFKYRFMGKEGMISLGVYPDIGLKEARDRREQTRKLVANGINPSEHRKAIKQAAIESYANTFEVVALEWHQKHSVRWTEGNKKKVLARLEKDVLPWLGKQRIETINAPDLLKILNRVENRGAADTAHRVLQTCGQIFRYAVATGRIKYNPCPDLRGALMPVKKDHYAAITEPKELGGLLRAIRGYQGDMITKAALQLTPLVFLRPGELRNAMWAEIDFENALWTIPAQRMKVKNQGHLVPLSRQAIEILRDVERISYNSMYVFPGIRTKKRPISDNTINAALRRMGYSREVMTAHGFRATARTILDEILAVRPDIIEHQLAHAVRDPNGRAYNRTSHLAERKKMMQDWADYLDKLEGER